MTTILDRKLGPGLVKLIKKLDAKGLARNVVVVKESAAAVAYDPRTGTASPGTATYTAKMAPATVDKDWQSSGLAADDDTGGMFAAELVSFTPELGDIVQWNGLDWRMVLVRAIRTGENIAGWTVVLQRA